MGDAPKVGSDLIPGTLDMLILNAVRRGDAMHGYVIAQSIHDVSEDALRLQEGALYPALHRLEVRGLLRSSWSVSENNRRAKYCAITALEALPANRWGARRNDSQCRGAASASHEIALRGTLPQLQVAGLDDIIRRIMRFEKIWIEQCRATRCIKRRFGAKSALDYLVGEKLPMFAGAALHDAAFARELPRFLAAVWRVFNQYELAGYVASQKPAVRKRLRTLLYLC